MGSSMGVTAAGCSTASLKCIWAGNSEPTKPNATASREFMRI